LKEIANQCIELGRSCVSPEYRTGSVVSLLWSAISVLMMRTDLVYMLGCVSLEETDPAVGWAIYEYIREQYPAQQKQIATPKADFKLPKPSRTEIEQILDDPLIESYMPPLFKGYLRLGAFICGEPAIDKEFGTIDYFIMVDIRRVPEKYIRFFHYIRPKTK
jgi:putative hemolysin